MRMVDNDHLSTGEGRLMFQKHKVLLPDLPKKGEEPTLYKYIKIIFFFLKFYTI